MPIFSYCKYITLYILAIWHLASCQQKVDTKHVLAPEETRRIAIDLTDNIHHIGRVTLSLPTRYDTIFNWINHSDCESCRTFRYRVQPKNKIILKEDSFFWITPQDSIERFTIIHANLQRINIGNDSSFILRHHIQYLKDYTISAKGRLTPEPSSDTLEKIGNNYFSIFTHENPDSTNTKYLQKLEATTINKGIILTFIFELNTRKEDPLAVKFKENSKYYLRTIRLSEDKAADLDNNKQSY